MFYGTDNLFIPSSTESVKQLSEAVKPKGSTVDQADVEHHGKLSEKWWDIAGPLHAMNVLRVQLVRDGLANAGYLESNPVCPLDGVKILDVGCGGGILAEPLARIGANVTGIDASPQQIAVAKDHATLDPSLSGRLSYIHTTVEEVAGTQSESFDAVVASEILEHVSDPELFLKVGLIVEKKKTKEANITVTHGILVLYRYLEAWWVNICDDFQQNFAILARRYFGGGIRAETHTLGNSRLEQIHLPSGDHEATGEM